VKEIDEAGVDFALSTGKKFYANLQTLSVNTNGELVYGSDGYVDEEFTAAEKAEIAAYMIQKWREWGAQ